MTKKEETDEIVKESKSEKTARLKRLQKELSEMELKEISLNIIFHNACRPYYEEDMDWEYWTTKNELKKQIKKLKAEL